MEHHPRFILSLLATAVVLLPSALSALDTDNDGLDDSVETNTGIYVSPANTGSNPNNSDSDGNSAGDWLIDGDRDGRKLRTQQRIRNRRSRLGFADAPGP